MLPRQLHAAACQTSFLLNVPDGQNHSPVASTGFSGIGFCSKGFCSGGLGMDWRLLSWLSPLALKPLLP